jgi:hypothetical protein
LQRPVTELSMYRRNEGLWGSVLPEHDGLSRQVVFPFGHPPTRISHRIVTLQKGEGKPGRLDFAR